MAIFETKSDFLEYIFSLTWKGNDIYRFECYPTGRYSLTDLIGYVGKLSRDETEALYSDIYFKAEKLKFDNLSKTYPQDLFCSLYEEELNYKNIILEIENSYPVANYILQWITEKIKAAYDNPISNKFDAGSRLPEVLTTPEALKIFEQARDLGLIGGEYKWLKGLQLLACFAREMSLKLRLGKGCNSDGTPRISWEHFERLFNIPKGKLREITATYKRQGKTQQKYGL